MLAGEGGIAEVTGTGWKSSFRAAVWLTVVMSAGWLICFWPARALRGGAGIQWMTIAAICCLVPGWCVVFISGVAIVRNELAAMLMQSGLRLFSVAGLALLVNVRRPEVGMGDFFVWLIFFYLLALLTEVWVLRQGLMPRSDRSS